MRRLPKKLTDDYAFEDGKTFKDVRDAMVAAATTGMWHIAHDLAHRYGLHNVICTKCGKPTGPQHTYYTYRERAIRICLRCGGGAVSLR
jgi:hypothetical protein